LVSASYTEAIAGAAPKSLVEERHEHRDARLRLQLKTFAEPAMASGEGLTYRTIGVADTLHLLVKRGHG
jgi:hypothetical protein